MSLQSDTVTFFEEEEESLITKDIKTPSHMSWIMAAGLIINAAMGAGLLNIAKAFDEAGGILVSSIVHAMVVLVVIGAYAILFICSDHTTASYEEFVLKKCGKFWQKVSSICIILYSYGLSITYFIIIGDQLNQILKLIFGEHYCSHWYLSRQVMIVITSLIIVLPLCFANSMKFLQIPSMLGVLAIIYVVFLVPVEYFVKPPTNTPIKIKTGPDSWTDVFLVLPTLCFAYQAHVNAVPVFGSLKSRSDCIKATLGSTAVLILSYCLVAVCGYLTFGTAVEHDILMSYDITAIPIVIAVAMVAIKTYSAYPVNIFCGRTAIESFMKSESSLKRRVIIISIWFSTTLAGAVFLPNISLAIHYLGALAASFIFIFPGLSLYFHTLQNWICSRNNILSISIAIFYIALGVFVTGLTLVQSLMDDIKPSKTQDTSFC